VDTLFISSGGSPLGRSPRQADTRRYRALVCRRLVADYPEENTAHVQSQAAMPDLFLLQRDDFPSAAADQTVDVIRP
jgi:hypothetical protein